MAASRNRDDVLYESGHTRVRRIWLPAGAGTVICKESFGPGSMAMVRQETLVLERLAGIEGVPRLASAPELGALVLADDAGVTLAATVETFDLSATTTLARRLAWIVSAIHGRGVVHKDITPSNILLVGDQRRPMLIDFGLATTFTVDRPGFTHYRDIIGTLAYISPEQTGRTGRAVDHRADLYALGAVLYELLSGHPPFEERDELQLVHDVLIKVPASLSETNPEVPPALAAIVARLLEKEPDRRYQSAEGLARDLETLTARPGGHFVLGKWDFPLHLRAPTQLIGRDVEVAALGAAFEQTLTGTSVCVLVPGSPGVGKSVLINELRLVVAERGGWFVTGKADQFRPDAAVGAALQALRGLGRLLLAEPEQELTATRQRLVTALGPNINLLTTALPEFATLIGPASPGSPGSPVVGDPLEAQSRLRQAVVDLLRGVVSPARPVVLVVDDLQWADPATLGFLDAILTGTGVPGLLMVGAFRADDVDLLHPLSVMLARWERLGVVQARPRLENLPPISQSQLLLQMLRLPPDRATELAVAIEGWTDGNPYDTVELVNSLRHDGVLRLREQGWVWDETLLRRHVGQGDVLELLRERIGRLPAPARELLPIIACLGTEVRLGLLAVAADASIALLRELLTPALEDGLLILERASGSDHDPGESTVRFPHDRLQQAASSVLDPKARSAAQLLLARRFATLPSTELEAAEQYLAAGAQIAQTEELRRIAQLYRIGATNARRASNYVAVEQFLSAAERILTALTPDDPTLVDLEIERHASLQALGRLEEADAVYASIEARTSDPARIAGATCIQISSLGQRNHQEDGLELGLALLARLGLSGPDEAFSRQIPALMKELMAWVSRLDLAADLSRPEIEDPSVLAIGKLLNQMLQPAFILGKHSLHTWILLQSQRMWVEHGPSAGLATNLCVVGHLPIKLLGDYRPGYAVAHHMLAIGEARGYEAETALMRHRYALMIMPWNEALENSIGQARLAYEGLLRSGDALQMVGSALQALMVTSLECVASLELYAGEIEATEQFVARTANQHLAGMTAIQRQLLRCLQGKTSSPGSFDDVSFSEAQYLADPEISVLATSVYHFYRSLAAGLFGDSGALARHSAAAIGTRSSIPGYSAALAYLFRAMSTADQARRGRGGQASREIDSLLTEFDECRNWLAGRAVDAPANFQHLVHLLDAERAWAIDDFRSAAIAFDAATRRSSSGLRPWHRALIAERTGCFYLAYGLEWTGLQAIRRARENYHAWGASGKVQQLDRAYPRLRALAHAGGGVRETRRSTGDGRSTSTVSSDTIDMLAILRASQALGSETNLRRLRAVIVEQLSALTGATDVEIVLRSHGTRDWILPPMTPDEEPVPAEKAGRLGQIPITAFRYAERTREPLLVDDATRDDRFAGDPFLSGLERCSLLVVPILEQGSVRAVLMLSNRQASGAFTNDRLDAVMLVTGQLIVSVSNALLYASLEQRVAERTAALAGANERLETLSRTDALTGLANRRRFDDVLDAEWQRARRAGQTISVLMIDVDHFKPFNDHYGHQAGDRCLRQVAAALAASTRGGSDLACRYGGEEFVVILPDGPGVDVTAERIRAGIAALSIPHAASPAGIVTVSIGSAKMQPTLTDSAQELVEQADTALYAAKRNGRNQVQAFQEIGGAGSRLDASTSP